MRESMRIDRLASIHLFQPSVRMLWSRRPSPTPILMYHSISVDVDNIVAPYYRTVTKPRVFARHLDFLSEHSYESVMLPPAEHSDRSHSPAAEKRVAITFDDGFKDFVTDAVPYLERYGFTATVFVSTGFAGDSTNRLHGRECMSWRDIGELSKAGIAFGSHTVNHPKLHELPWPDIDRELQDSKRQLEDAIGQPVCGFSYPYAFPSEDRDFVLRFREHLEMAGYQWSVTTRIGTHRPGDSRHFMKRLPINTCDDPALFSAKLCCGYDWLAGPQRLAKRMKTALGFLR